MNASEITFGVEIECFVPRQLVSEGRIAVGGYHHGIQVPELPQGWTAQRDGSVHTRSRAKVGVEIVSPVLKGVEGLRQIKVVLDWLRNNGASVNRKCGLHVHVGVGSDLSLVRKVTTMAANFEKAIYASTGTKSRERGSFCMPIASQYQGIAFNDTVSMAQRARTRYHQLNLTNLINGSRPTVEFRAFAGTLNVAKVIAHVRMVVGMVERAAKAKRVTNWTAKPVTETSPIFRKGGEGQTALTRLFYQLGWVKGRQSHVHGELAAPDLPSLETSKRTLRRLAKQYDRQP